MARFYPEVYDLQPWYHDFSELGLQTRFAVRRRDQLSQLFAPLRRSVWNFVLTVGAYDLVLCTGGLYHLTDPCGFQQRLRKTGSRYLVVQSVVTLETDAPDYFVNSAPGWRHGSRFTHAGLGQWLTEACWRILECATNELDANTRLCDRGSSYYRCEAAS